jgi:hypothetical protein
MIGKGFFGKKEIRNGKIVIDSFIFVLINERKKSRRKLWKSVK